jgi:hypothetical protein
MSESGLDAEMHIQWSVPEESWGTPDITPDCLFPPTSGALGSLTSIYLADIDSAPHMDVIVLDMSLCILGILPK